METILHDYLNAFKTIGTILNKGTIQNEDRRRKLQETVQMRRDQLIKSEICNEDDLEKAEEVIRKGILKQDKERDRKEERKEIESIFIKEEVVVEPKESRSPINEFWRAVENFKTEERKYTSSGKTYRGSNPRYDKDWDRYFTGANEIFENETGNESNFKEESKNEYERSNKNENGWNL